jgi:hypothetical protein
MRSIPSKWGMNSIMTKESLDRGALEGTEAFDLYLTEITNSVLAMTQQSALLAQALSERAVLLAALAGEAGNTEPAINQATENEDNVVKPRP